VKTLFYDFLLYCALALAGILARVGLSMGGEPPPSDPELFAKWRRKQLWLVIGELLTVPMFGAAWIGIVHNWQPQIELVVPGCMVSGALGFSFWLDAIQRLINRRLENA
jgi:hypothetical protein